MKLRTGEGVTFKIRLQAGFNDLQLSAIKFLTCISDHLDMIICIDEWDSAYFDLDILGSSFSTILDFFTSK